MRVFASLSMALLLACPASAPAGQIYRWVDERGVVHYTDRAPENAPDAPGAVQIRRVAGEPGQLVRLELRDGPDSHTAFARNLLVGPVEVTLEYSRRENIRATPELPLRQVLPAAGEIAVARFELADTQRPGDLGLRLLAMPGDPAAQSDDSIYRVPIDGVWRIDQGYGGGFSHDDPENRYAVDFAVEEGTPILAAREGVVMQVARDFDRSGLDREKFGGRANHIRILHGDGTMAVYAHLQVDGVLVREGQRVRAGQLIGYSGNTGFSSGPHLHFAVQVNRGMRLESIPFRMAGPDGSVAIPGQ